MSKAKPKKWPEKGRLCWIEWHDACDTQGSGGEGEVALAYTMGCYWGQKFEEVRGRRVKVVVVLYDWFDCDMVDAMNVPVKNILRWGYGRVPKRILDKH